MNAPATTYQMMLLDQPAAMRLGRAAAHCGVSAGHFKKMVVEGIMPLPRDGSGVKLWLRLELDEALFSLNSPEIEGGSNSCDAAFGL